MMSGRLDAWGLLPDYRMFLKATPPHDIDTHAPLPVWPQGAAPMPRLPEKQLDDLHDSGALRHIDRLYCLESLEELCGATGHDEMAFWPNAFMRHAYPVGLGHGGDPVVHVREGKYRGAVLLTDHNFNEEWWLTLSGDEEAADEIEDFAEELARVDFTTFESMTTDQFIDFFLPERATFDGTFIHLADTFTEFYTRLCSHYGSAR